MPVITVNCPALDVEKKRELVKGFTEIASSVMGIPKEAFVVLINENPHENVGVGGVLLADRGKSCEDAPKAVKIGPISIINGRAVWSDVYPSTGCMNVLIIPDKKVSMLA